MKSPAIPRKENPRAIAPYIICFDSRATIDPPIVRAEMTTNAMSSSIMVCFPIFDLELYLLSRNIRRDGKLFWRIDKSLLRCRDEVKILCHAQSVEGASVYT